MKRKSKRLTKAILETAKNFRDGGIIDEEVYQIITIRHLKKYTSKKIAKHLRLRDLASD